MPVFSAGEGEQRLAGTLRKYRTSLEIMQSGRAIPENFSTGLKFLYQLL
jgi:hypothetical protein